MGPFWLTGGGYGLDASWWACLVLLIAFTVLHRATRELDFRHNAPVFVGAGIPVDIDAAARRQHETAMGETSEPTAPSLVQILPVVAPPGAPKPASDSAIDRDDQP